MPVDIKKKRRKKRWRNSVLFKRLWFIQSGLCWVCGNPMKRTAVTSQFYATWEHKIRLIDGGLDDSDNLALSHKKCNNERHNRIGVDQVKEKFTQYVERNAMDNFQWATCPRCHESVVTATIRSSQKNHSFEPKPVAGAGTEINPVYDRHFCPTANVE